MVVPGLETDLVTSDDFQGGFLITSHLIELGHRQILHLAGPVIFQDGALVVD